MERKKTGFRPSRIAMAQIAPALGDLHRNLDLHIECIQQAKEAEADAILFPELSLTGYFVRDMVPDLARTDDCDEIRALLDAAGDMAVVAGFIEETDSHRFHNATFYAEGGRILHVHRKVYLPTYGLFDEQRYFAAGNRIKAFDTALFGKTGILICEDFWHLSAAAIMQAEGVNMLICVSNSPARGISNERIQTAETVEQLAKALGHLLGAVVVVVNRSGFEDGLCFWGGSCAAGPEGNLIAKAPMFDESLKIFEFDPATLRRQRVIAPLARDERLLLTIEEFKRIKKQQYDG